MTNKQSPKKVVKNIEKPKSQRRNCEVVKHFEPSVNYAACRSNLTVEIPLIKVNSDDELTSPKSPKTVHFPVKRQTIVKIPPPNIRKYKNSIKDSSSKQTTNEQRFVQRLLFPTHSKLKSSSSSSLDAVSDKNPNRYKAKPKSYYSNTSSIQAQKLVKSAGERGSVFHSKNGSLKSVTDPALIQRELNLKALKQEILENKRSTAFERQRPDTSHFKPSPQIQKLKAEILQSKTSNILQKKLLVTELRSEIAQYQHFNQYHVYNTFGDEPSKKPEKDDSNEPENENLVKCRAGSKKVSIADYVLKNEDGVRSGSAVEEIDLSRNEASSGGPSGTGTVYPLLTVIKDTSLPVASFFVSDESILFCTCVLHYIQFVPHIMEFCSSEREGRSSSYCCARNCQNRRNNSNIFFFQLPVDRERAKIWLSACGRDDLIKHLGSLDGLRLCAAHFEDNMFGSVLKDRLVANAVPTIMQEGSMLDTDVHMIGIREEIISTTNASETEAACSSSLVGDYSEESELLTSIDIKDEEKCLLDIPETHESSVEIANIKITPLNKTTQSDQNIDISPLIEQKVADAGVGHYSEEHLKSSKLLTELNIKSEEEECIDDEFKEVDHEEMKVSNAHIDMFFESLLGVAKTLTKDNQMILTDKLKEIVNECR